MEEVELEGLVSQIRYRNRKNGYIVFELSSGKDKITCVGYPPDIYMGEFCTVAGKYITHPVYGRQLKVERFIGREPDTLEEVRKYLGGGSIKGVRERLAARIVETFGDKTLYILENQPEKLSEVKGISLEKARDIAGQFASQEERRNAVIFMEKYGISMKEGGKIWDTYEEDIYEILKTNPYRLAEDVDGIGFIRADNIARRAGIGRDSEYRASSGLLYCLEEALLFGNTWVPQGELLRKASTLLDLDEEVVKPCLQNLAMDRKVIIKRKKMTLPGGSDENEIFERAPQEEDENQVFLKDMYRIERECAALLLALDKAAEAELPFGRDELSKEIDYIEMEEGIELDALQRKAICDAAESGILIISGGPGTGKTTTINTLIRLFEEGDQAVLLAAPTGRAAKRMAEACGREAKTIHRLLEYKAEDDEDKTIRRSYHFERNEKNPLEADLVIIDEMSMVDTYLFHALLLALKPGTRLVLVGDANQLPSVGPGRVLRDLIESGAFRTIILEKIFRQAASSDIVMNAHRILSGEALTLDNRSRDFFFLERSDPRVIYKHLVLLMREKLPGYVDADPGEIQVLSPMKKGPVGVIALNEVLQSALNPPSKDKAEVESGDFVFREGDKVMQIRNNYELEWEVPGNYGYPTSTGKGVFNGDMGTIIRIEEKERTMLISFDEGHVAHYSFDALEDLEPAFAVTVHKSQGSEYPAVLIPLLGGPKSLMTRNLLYTAVTRAKKCVVILGSRKALEEMEENATEIRRLSGLKDRIHELYELSKEDGTA